MKKSLLIISTLLVVSVQAQSNWLQSFGGFQNDELLDAEVDSNGDLISVGYFFGSFNPGTGPLSAAGNSDIYVMKTDDAGNILWAIQAGGVGPDKAESVSVDDAGNSYITGYFHTSADFGVINVTGVDREAFVAKIDNAGNWVWVSTMGGPLGDSGFGVEVDNAGNIYATGEYRGSALFGSDNLTSMGNSADVFITKLDPSGNFIWTRDGNAPQDDRGISLTVDAANNVYVCGEFSEDITFDVLHPNTAMNAGFLVAYDPSGIEMWFDLFRAGQVLLKDVEFGSNSLYMTGDFIGNLIVEDINGTQTFTSSEPYNILTCKLSTNGGLTWLSDQHSDNEIYSNQLCIDASGSPYVVGEFKCTFSEMNDQYGNSTFHSVGFKDVFYMKYNSGGSWQWARQNGGTRDDNCSAIIIKTTDEPILAGSYEFLINIPSGTNFTFLPGQFVSEGNVNCGDNTYGNYAREFAVGARDMFLTHCYDAAHPPYDYYWKYTACDYDTIPPCILSTCQDSVEFCEGSTQIFVDHFQESNGASPDYDYLWNTGVTLSYIFPNTTGWHWVEIEREDGCTVWVDSIYVTVNPLPDPPLVTDSWDVNILTDDPELVDSCGTDSLYIWGSPADAITVDITWANGTYINDSTIHAGASDIYTVIATTAAGCSSSTDIEVSLDTFALNDTLDPYIIWTDPQMQLTDSIIVCGNNPMVEAYIIDSTFLNVVGATPDKYTFWYLDGNFIDSIFHLPDTFGTVIFAVQDTGWHTLEAHFFNECGDSVVYIFDRDFHITFIPDPTVQILAPSLACPGDTLTVYADYTSSNLQWTASTMIQNWGDSIQVVVSSGGILISASVDTTVGTLTCAAQWNHLIDTDDQPLITVLPGNGYICPGDSLYFEATVGLAWEWIGPFGDILGNGNSIYADDPGDYYCNVTMPSGCTLSSNFITATAYSSPYIDLLSPVICQGDSTDLEVFGPTGMTINWLPPLSGSNVIQTVSDTGWYYVETDFCGIVETDSAHVILSDVNATLNATGDTTICGSDSLLLFTNPGYATYTWNGTPGTDSLYVTQEGIYVVEVVDTAGCSDISDTLNVIHYPGPPPPIASDTIICKGTDITLNASGQGVLSWYNGSNLVSTGNTHDLTNVQTDISFSIYNEDTTCPNDFTIMNVIIYSGSIDPGITGPATICEGDSLALHPNVADSLLGYVWQGPVQSSSDSVFIINPVLATDGGTYTLNYADSYCVSDTAYFELEVIPTILDLQIFYDEPCEGDSLTMTLQPQNFLQYYWLENGGIFSTSPTVTIPTDGETGFNIDIVVNNQGCFSDTSHFIVPVNPNPISNLPEDTLFCFGELVQNWTSYNYDWDMSANPDPFYDSLLVITYTDTHNCITIDSTNVNFKECHLFKPNIFTPNGDGNNDVYFFEADKGRVLHFIILNRWGVTIDEEYANAWDGRDHNGDDVPDGWYYYILYYKDYNGITQDVHGTFYLTRTLNE